MRKILAVIFFSVVTVLSLMADYEKKGTFNFSSYYNGKRVNDEYLFVEIYNPGGETDFVNLNGTVLITQQNNMTDVEVFRWLVCGNTEKKVNIKFGISPLTAYYNEYYYIPVHTFKIKALSYEFDDVVEAEYGNRVLLQTNPQIGNSKEIAFIYKAKEKSPYPFLSQFSANSNEYRYYSSLWKDQTNLYSGMKAETITSTYKYYNSNNQLVNIPTSGNSQDYNALYRSEWILHGSCSLTVSDYEAPNGRFEYVSNVIVEVWVD